MHMCVAEVMYNSKHTLTHTQTNQPDAHQKTCVTQQPRLKLIKETKLNGRQR